MCPFFQMERDSFSPISIREASCRGRMNFGFNSQSILEFQTVDFPGAEERSKQWIFTMAKGVNIPVPSTPREVTGSLKYIPPGRCDSHSSPKQCHLVYGDHSRSPPLFTIQAQQTETANTQLIHLQSLCLRLREHRGRGGRQVVRARGPEFVEKYCLW